MSILPTERQPKGATTPAPQPAQVTDLNDRRRKPIEDEIRDLTSELRQLDVATHKRLHFPTRDEARERERQIERRRAVEWRLGELRSELYALDEPARREAERREYRIRELRRVLPDVERELFVARVHEHEALAAAHGATYPREQAESRLNALRGELEALEAGDAI